MSGLTLLVVNYATSPEVGGVISNLLGVSMALVSSVYYPMEQAPAVCCRRYDEITVRSD